MSSPRLAHFPPTLWTMLRSHSSKRSTYLEMSIARSSARTAHERMSISPVDPSTLILCPVLSMDVAEPVPTTAGRPYSRHTIAAWHMTPPTSVTAALIFWNAGAQLGEVVGATRISPSCRSPISLAVRQTRTVPSTIPGDPGNPIILVKSPAGYALEPCPLGHRRGRDPPEHDSERFAYRFRNSPHGIRWRPFPELFHALLTPGYFFGPYKGSAGVAAGCPSRNQVPQRFLDFSTRFMYQTSSTSLMNLCSTMIRATSRILFQKRL